MKKPHSGITRVYGIANALMVASMAERPHPIVLRSRLRPATLCDLRTVAAAAGLPTMVCPDPTTEDVLGPPRVVAVTGICSDAHARRVVAAAKAADPDVLVVVILSEDGFREPLGALARAMRDAGEPWEDDDDLLDHQRVPSTLA
jgi:hypothetical protein